MPVELATGLGHALADHAAPSYPAVRAVPEEDSPVRTPFQRDRDRIVHSKAFRRLKHKTQVFISPGGRPLPDAPDPHARDVHDRAHRRAGARPERGPDRGDRARPRPRASAVRPHRRERARRVHARALRHGLPPQRALAAGRRAARARRPRAQPDGAGSRRDPSPHGAGQAGHAGGPDREAGGPDRLHQPRHRRQRPRGRARSRRAAAGGDRRARADGLEAHRHARAGPGRALRRGRRHRAVRRGRRRDAPAAQVHVPARLPDAGRPARAAARRADAARAVRALRGEPAAVAGA